MDVNKPRLWSPLYHWLTAPTWKTQNTLSWNIWDVFSRKHGSLTRRLYKQSEAALAQRNVLLLAIFLLSPWVFEKRTVFFVSFFPQQEKPCGSQQQRNNSQINSEHIPLQEAGGHRGGRVTTKASQPKGCGPTAGQKMQVYVSAKWRCLLYI